MITLNKKAHMIAVFGLMALLALAGADATATSMRGSALAAQSCMMLSQAQGLYIGGNVTNSITGNPVKNVVLVLSANITKQIADAATDANGDYLFENIAIDQLYTITLYKAEYLPGTVTDIDPSAPNVDVALVPLGVTTPRNVIAFSGPRLTYVEWDANPEYNLQGYYVARLETDINGNALGSWQRISNLLSAPPGSAPPTEYQDENIQNGSFYVYRVIALSAADRESTASDASDPPVQGQWLTMFMPQRISIDSDFGGLYLWDIFPDDLVDESWVRIPISTESAYEVSSVAMDIVAELPTDLLEITQTSDIEVLPTGITEGMVYNYSMGALQAGELRISAAGTEERELYGVGTLFDVYAKLNAGGANGCGPLALVEDTYDPGPPETGREGVRLFDLPGANAGTSLMVSLRDGELCVEVTPCIHGDVNMDRQITEADAQMITDIKVGLVARDANQCLPDVADINLDKRVDAADASQILLWIRDGSLNPPPAAGKSTAERKSYAYAAWDEKDDQPVVRIETVSGNQGETISTDIVIDSGSNELPLAGFTLLVAYPSGETGLEFLDAQLGSAFPGDFKLSKNAETTANPQAGFGSLMLAASSEESLATKGATTLASLSFRVGPLAVEGDQPLKLKAFESNDAFGHTPRQGSPGQARIQELAPQVDETPPEITLTGSAMVTVDCGSAYTDAGATATDDVDGDLGSVSGVGTVDTNTPGTYAITYDVSDAAGNQATQVIRTVVVQNNCPAPPDTCDKLEIIFCCAPGGATGGGLGGDLIVLGLAIRTLLALPRMRAAGKRG